MSKEGENAVEATDTNENSNESNSDTTSSNTKEPDYDATLETDRGKRFEFLLKQTEIFAHFMNSAPSKNSPPKAPRGRKPKVDKNADTGDHRHRKTEQEEDEELLAETNQKAKTLFRFEASPPYIKADA
uniref:Uncharacterized protein n=1 Tax=Anopheles minimus TaxID=112268 RepID=A0A182WE67_9DIPT